RVAIDASGLAVALDLHRPTVRIGFHLHVGMRLARDPHRVRVERRAGGAAVPKERVVLAPERAPTLSADRVAPDDLVHQPVAEDLVELHANVVHGTPVEMDEERAARREHAMESDEAG